MRWLLPVLLLGVAIALGSSPRASLEAHALLVRADPPQNAQLREPPSEMTLYFSEPLEQEYSRITVINQDGEAVETGFEFLSEDNAAMRVLLGEVEPGFLSVQWATVSTVDGHRITGSYPLTILNEDGSLPAGEPPEGSSVSGADANPLRVINKWVLLIAGSILAGAFGFFAYVTPSSASAPESPHHRFNRRAQVVAVVALAVIAVAGLADLVLQAVDIDAAIASVLKTQWGERWIYRHLLLLPLALMLAALIAGFANRRLIAFIALIDIAAYMVLTASVSHAGAGGGSFWAIGSDFVHLMASSVWIGMVLLLVLLFAWTRKHLEQRERYGFVSTALQRFSLVAAVSVALLLFTGMVNAVIELGRIEDLVETGYGRALLLKLILLLPLLGIAGYNAYLLRPDFAEANNPDANVRDRQGILQDLEQQLNKRIRWEAVAAIAVLAVVALLVQLTPTRGRVEAPSQAAGEYVETVDVDNLQVTMVITPNEPGFNTFEVYLAGGVDEVEGLRLEFTDPGGFASESRLILEPSNPPTFYLGQGPYISEAGVWNIILNIRRASGTDLRPLFIVEVEDTAPVATSSSRTGGAFDSPVNFDTVTVALLAASAVASIGVVVGSLPRPGMPEGYLGWLAAEAAYRLGPMNVRPVWTLGALVVFGIALGLILGDHLHPPLSEEEATRDNPIPATEESIARGALLFSQNCAICHGESGRGDGPAADSLPLQPVNLYDHIPFHPDQFFFGVISKGLSGVMPAFEDQISVEDRWNILNFLRATFSTDNAAER